MALTIDLEPEVEGRLQQEASRHGLEPGEYARRLIEQGLSTPLSERQKALLEMLDSWEKEDSTDDPAELQAAEEELEAFKQAMNENRRRAGEEPLFP